MWEDPIVAEVHAIREKLLAKFNYDLRAMFEDARKRERTSGHKIVSPRRRKRAKLMPIISGKCAMKDDPIVTEVRKGRQEPAARFNYDIDAIAKDIRSREGKDGRPVVTLPPKRKVAKKSR